MKWEVWEVWKGSDVEAGRPDSMLIEADTPADAAIEFRHEENDWDRFQFEALIAVATPTTQPVIVRVTKEMVPQYSAEILQTENGKHAD